MAYNEKLADKIRAALSERFDVEEKKMFGGLSFMVSNHMCCGVVGDTLMARVGPANYEKCLADKFAREMDFTGRSMNGMVYVSTEGIKSKSQLGKWINLCTRFVESLPPKKTKPR